MKRAADFIVMVSLLFVLPLRCQEITSGQDLKCTLAAKLAEKAQPLSQP